VQQDTERLVGVFFFLWFRKSGKARKTRFANCSGYDAIV